MDAAAETGGKELPHWVRTPSGPGRTESSVLAHNTFSSDTYGQSDRQMRAGRKSGRKPWSAARGLVGLASILSPSCKKGLELETGFEPATSTLARLRSTE